MPLKLRSRSVRAEECVEVVRNAFTDPELPHILVVDDENGPRQALRMLLKEEFHVVLAESVAEAFDVLSREPIELIITDIRMPKQSGVDLLREAKSLYPEVQVIIFTGYGHLDTAMKAVEYGAFAYVEKPFDNDEMFEVVRAGHSRYREEKERRALEQMALEASRFETLGRLVSGMMHDMGSPLTVLSSHIELLSMNPHRDDIERRLSTMKVQIEHCSEMARSTMDYLRCDQNDGMPWRLNAVVSSCLDIARSLLREQSVEVEQDLMPSLPFTVGEMVLVRQAILNLITNACQAMESIEGPKKIRIKTWAEPDYACISVEDSGAGVPAKDRHRIFDTFYTTKGVGGTGLGLSVVRNVAQKFGGSAVLDADYEEGARFVIRFPIPQ